MKVFFMNKLVLTFGIFMQDLISNLVITDENNSWDISHKLQRIYYFGSEFGIGIGISERREVEKKFTQEFKISSKKSPSLTLLLS